MVFKKMENSDETALTPWNRFQDFTIEKLTAGYTRFGVKFDEFSGEPQIQLEIIVEVEDILKEKGALEGSVGSWIIDFVKHAGKKGLSTQIVSSAAWHRNYRVRELTNLLMGHSWFHRGSQRGEFLAPGRCIRLGRARGDNLCTYNKYQSEFDVMEHENAALY
jgi:hypothetical protein